MAANSSDRATPAISAVVCTRGRGGRLVSTVETILANDHPNFELIVIDQNEDDVSLEALRPYLPDHRFRYVRSEEIGLGRARNMGLVTARATIVAFADDDVTVPAHWLSVMQREFDHRPEAAVVFCNVVAAPHDSAAGFIPAYERSDVAVVQSMWGKCRARGIGAGLAVRRQAMLDLGGFDPLLGAGGKFPSCEDGDAAVRALLKGWCVVETSAVAVVHDGFRTWAEGRELTRRDWYGIGAAYSKPIKAGRLSVLIVVLYEGLIRAALVPILTTIRRRRPSGLRQVWHFWRGFFAGLRYPIDRATLCFRDVAPQSLAEAAHLRPGARAGAAR